MKNAYNTSAYGSFAYVYDIFMDNVPYASWAGYLNDTLREYGISDGQKDNRRSGIGTWMWNRKADDFAWQSGI